MAIQTLTFVLIVVMSNGDVKLTQDIKSLQTCEQARSVVLTGNSTAGWTRADRKANSCFQIYNGRSYADRIDDASSVIALAKLHECLKK